MIAGTEAVAAAHALAEEFLAKLEAINPPLAAVPPLDVRRRHRVAMGAVVQSVMSYLSHKNPEAGLDFLIAGVGEGVGAAMAQGGPIGEANGLGALTAGLESGVKAARRQFTPTAPPQ